MARGLEAQEYSQRSIKHRLALTMLTATARLGVQDGAQGGTVRLDQLIPANPGHADRHLEVEVQIARGSETRGGLRPAALGSGVRSATGYPTQHTTLAAPDHTDRHIEVGGSGRGSGMHGKIVPIKKGRPWPR